MDEKEMQKFIEKAYKDGKVRDLEEAFDEFPPDEEWHHGKLENVICENNTFYGNNILLEKDKIIEYINSFNN